MNILRLMPKINKIIEEVTSEHDGFSGLIDWKSKHDVLSKIHEVLISEEEHVHEQNEAMLQEARSSDPIAQEAAFRS